MQAPDHIEFFREITLRIASSLDIEEALTRTFEYLKGFLPAEAVDLSYLDWDRKCLFPVAMVSRGKPFSLLDESVGQIPLDDDFLEFVRKKQMDDRHRVQILNHPDELPPPVLRCFPHLATCSTIAMPLAIRDEFVGHLAISAEGFGLYTDAHVALLETVRDPIALAMSNARRHLELARMRDLLAEDNRALSIDIERMSGTEVIGADFGLCEVMQMVRQIAPSNSPALLLGETGTGKEVIANAIHTTSPRRDAPMIRMQCGAIPETLLDSELFGHEKGAFTGALERKRGRFERAHGGTLFLDEIGELSPEAQVKLLRVLQEKQFERVGGTHTLTADVRVIAATHRDLGRMVREGNFREDLWYRLNVLPIRIPPLRLRRDDIPSLVQHFVQRKVRELNLLNMPQIDNETLARLKAYDWPGNVRELQNIVERALILSRGDRLMIPALRSNAPIADAAETVPVSVQTMDEAVADHIRLALKHTSGRIAGHGGAAEILGMNPSTLRFRMKKLGMRAGAR